MAAMVGLATMRGKGGKEVLYSLFFSKPGGKEVPASSSEDELLLVRRRVVGEKSRLFRFSLFRFLTFS